MKLDQLKAGDCLLQPPSEWIGDVIAAVEGAPWVHAAMVVEDPDAGGLWVYEMTWPELKRTVLKQWIAGNPCFVAPLKTPLDPLKKTRLRQWWYGRLGMWYDVPELAELAPVVLWERFCYWIGIKSPISKVQPIAGDGVCSVNVAWVWRATGLPVTETAAMTPADIPGQMFVGPVESVVPPRLVA